MATQTISRTRQRQRSGQKTLESQQEELEGESQATPKVDRSIYSSFTGVLLWEPYDQDAHVFDYHGTLSTDRTEELQDVASRAFHLATGAYITFRVAPVVPSDDLVDGRLRIITKIEVCRNGKWKKGETNLLDEVFAKVGGRRMFGEGGRPLPHTSTQHRTRRSPPQSGYTTPVPAQDHPSLRLPGSLPEPGAGRQLTNTERARERFPLPPTSLDGDPRRRRTLSSPAFETIHQTTQRLGSSRQHSLQADVPLPANATGTNIRSSNVMSQLQERINRLRAVENQQRQPPTATRPVEGQGQAHRPHPSSPVMHLLSTISTLVRKEIWWSAKRTSPVSASASSEIGGTSSSPISPSPPPAWDFARKGVDMLRK
ncbi:hypothetical protein IAR50_000982 [Cryptococcus sp. DSM 104548]